jgi:hypothetical protein
LGGVISSTLLTLVLVPVMYTLLDGLPTRLASGLTTIVRRGARRAPIALPPSLDALSSRRTRQRPTGTEGP